MLVGRGILGFFHLNKFVFTLGAVKRLPGDCKSSWGLYYKKYDMVVPQRWTARLVTKRWWVQILPGAGLFSSLLYTLSGLSAVQHY